MDGCRNEIVSKMRSEEIHKTTGNCTINILDLVPLLTLEEALLTLQPGAESPIFKLEQTQ